MIKVKKFVFNDFAVNSFVLHDESQQCIIIDPGCTDDNQRNELKSYIIEKSLKPVYLINTHGHVDHIAGNAFVQREFQCPTGMHKEDLFLLENAKEFGSMMGFQLETPPVPDHFFSENERIEFGNATLMTIFVPGHSPGSICLYSEPDKLLICGDVLFNGGIGRTDLFGGNYKQLISHIRNKLLVLPHDTVVYPGHGPETTIGQEYDTNPFLK